VHAEGGRIACHAWHSGGQTRPTWDNYSVALKPLDELVASLGVPYRTLNRIISERGIARQKFPGDRRTWVDEDDVRAVLAEPQRRPARQPRPGSQIRDARGRFSPIAGP
jgi:hypothetical protein